MRRPVALAAAVGAAIVGLTMAFVPSLGAAVATPDVVTTAVGALAIVAGVVRANAWLGHDSEETVPAERERGVPNAVPGDDTDRLLRTAPAIGSNARDQRLVHLREDLRETAVDVLVAYRGYEREAAEDAVADGTWTDDRYAAEFFGTPQGSGDSIRESLAGSVYGENPFAKRARHAAAAIESMTRGDEA
jgi:hypothetical protein